MLASICKSILGVTVHDPLESQRPQDSDVKDLQQLPLAE